MIISINRLDLFYNHCFIGFNSYSQEINPEDTEVWSPVPI